jgi:hypothetical protein
MASTSFTEYRDPTVADDDTTEPSAQDSSENVASPGNPPVTEAANVAPTQAHTQAPTVNVNIVTPAQAVEQMAALIGSLDLETRRQLFGRPEWGNANSSNQASSSTSPPNANRRTPDDSQDAAQDLPRIPQPVYREPEREIVVTTKRYNSDPFKDFREFSGKNITVWLEDYNSHGDRVGAGNEDKVNWITGHVIREIRKKIEKNRHYILRNWKGLQDMLLDEYQEQDSERLKRTIQWFESFLANSRQSQTTYSQYKQEFEELAFPLVVKGDLIARHLGGHYLKGLPERIRDAIIWELDDFNAEDYMSVDLNKVQKLHQLHISKERVKKELQYAEPTIAEVARRHFHPTPLQSRDEVIRRQEELLRDAEGKKEEIVSILDIPPKPIVPISTGDEPDPQVIELTDALKNMKIHHTHFAEWLQINPNIEYLCSNGPKATVNRLYVQKMVCNNSFTTPGGQFNAELRNNNNSDPNQRRSQQSNPSVPTRFWNSNETRSGRTMDRTVMRKLNCAGCGSDKHIVKDCPEMELLKNNGWIHWVYNNNPDREPGYWFGPFTRPDGKVAGQKKDGEDDVPWLIREVVTKYNIPEDWVTSMHFQQAMEKKKAVSESGNINAMIHTNYTTLEPEINPDLEMPYREELIENPEEDIALTMDRSDMELVASQKAGKQVMAISAAQTRAQAASDEAGPGRRRARETSDEADKDRREHPPKHTRIRSDTAPPFPTVETDSEDVVNGPPNTGIPGTQQSSQTIPPDSQPKGRPEPDGRIREDRRRDKGKTVHPNPRNYISPHPYLTDAENGTRIRIIKACTDAPDAILAHWLESSAGKGMPPNKDYLNHRQFRTILVNSWKEAEKIRQKELIAKKTRMDRESPGTYENFGQPLWSNALMYHQYPRVQEISDDEDEPVLDAARKVKAYKTGGQVSFMEEHRDYEIGTQGPRITDEYDNMRPAEELEIRHKQSHLTTMSLPLPFVLAEVGDIRHKIRCLVDTGSQMNVMQEKTADALQIPWDIFDQDPHQLSGMHSADGGFDAFLGVAYSVPIVVGSITIPTHFYILRKLSLAIILGIPYLARTRFSCRFNARGKMECSIISVDGRRRVHFVPVDPPEYHPHFQVISPFFSKN